MRKSYRWDEKTQTFVEVAPKDGLRYEDVRRVVEAQEKQRELEDLVKAHPGVYL